VAISLLWTLIGILIALLNTALDEEATDVSGPLGLHLWSTMSIVCAGVAVAIFLHQFHMFAEAEERAGVMSYRLGFSFWLLCAAMVVQMGPMLLVCMAFPICSRWGKEQRDEIDMREVKSGDILY